jgi:hypothetical protein
METRPANGPKENQVGRASGWIATMPNHRSIYLPSIQHLLGDSRPPLRILQSTVVATCLPLLWNDTMIAKNEGVSRVYWHIRTVQGAIPVSVA